MSASRSAIVHEIEDAGVIAVIRLSNGGQLRAVADAMIAAVGRPHRRRNSPRSGDGR
jgi:hypothetical protein